MYTSLDIARNKILELEAAFEQEKVAREKAEMLLKTRETNMYNINKRLNEQYVASSMKNQEVDYLLKITIIYYF